MGWNKMASNLLKLIGTKVRDEFGTWVIARDGDTLVARQRNAEVLLLDPSDFARFGIAP
jgi:hypothetical protein